MATSGEGEFCDRLKDLSLSGVLSKWLLEIKQMPSDPQTWLIHIGLFLIMWYTVKFIFRLILSLLGPMIVITSILLIIRSIQRIQNGQLSAYLDEAFMDAYQWLAKFSEGVFKKAVELLTLEDGIGDFGKPTQRFL